MMKNIFFLFTFCFFISCKGKNKVPLEIIQPAAMQKILWDMIRAQALSAQIARKDSTVNEIAETKTLNKKIFEIHKISATAFNKSYIWYTNHPDIMRMVFDSLNAQSQRESQVNFKEKYGHSKFDQLKKLHPIKNIDSLKAIE